MKTTNKVLLMCLIITTGLSGCASSFIETKSGSEGVAVVGASNVSSCELKSKVTSSVLSKVWFISRSQESVEENLLQMARNSAVESGSDTIVKGESTQLGERTFALYKCKH